MKRRSFFNALGKIAAGLIVCPSVITPKASEAFKWKKASTGLWVVNPDYIAAEYEVGLIWSVRYFYGKWQWHQRVEGLPFVREPLADAIQPIRFVN